MDEHDYNWEPSDEGIGLGVVLAVWGAILGDGVR